MNKVPPILSISFRPFFLLVALIAVFNPIFWVLSYLGHLSFDLVSVSPLFWHGHEMIFGFSGAMIAGFILTASANWTGSEPYRGLALLGLVLVWMVERLSYFIPMDSIGLLIVSNLFFPTLTIMLLIKLINFPKQKYIFIPILLVLTIGKLLNSWGYLFDNGSFEILGRGLATGSLRFIVLLIAGRVIPFFSSKRLGIKVTVPPALNMISLIPVALLIFPWEPLLGKSFVALLFIIAIMGNLFRQVLWRPEKSIRIPILLILHVGVTFITLSLALEGLGLYYSHLNFSQAPLHLLMAAGAATVGVGIMSRVSLGHTGRVIEADRWTCLAYILVILGGLLRVVTPITITTFYIGSLPLSVVLWSGGFLIFLFRYWNILVTPRPDGK